MIRLLILSFLLLVSRPLRADSWFFAATGDSHLGGSHPIVFDQVVSEMNKRLPEFLVMLGDGVDSAKVENFDLLSRACSRLQVPFIYVIGNHDVLRPNLPHDRADYLKARALLSPNAPPDRTYFAFSHNNSRFIVLDTAGVRVDEWGIRVSDRNQWAWLEAELRDNRKSHEHAFVMMHVPTRNPLAQLVTRQHHWFTDEKEADDFEKLMARYKVDMVLAAHDHMFESWRKDGVTYVLCGSSGGKIIAPDWVGGFYNYVEVHINSKEVKLQVVPLLKSVKIDSSVRTVQVGKTVTLRAAGVQLDNSNLALKEPIIATWTSSDPKVGNIDAITGVFKAVAPGTTRITLRCGVQTAEVEMKVVK